MIGHEDLGPSRPSGNGAFLVRSIVDEQVPMCGPCRRAGTCRLGIDRELRHDQSTVRFNVTCPPEFEGHPGIAHGGWTMSILDCMLGHLPTIHGFASVTATITVDFRKPVLIGQPMMGVAELTKREGSRWCVEGDMRSEADGNVVARASGIWVQRS